MRSCSARLNFKGDKLLRREFLHSGVLIAGGSVLMPLLSSFGLASTISVKNRKTLVVIFQRGAVDALSMILPHGDRSYNKELRPNLHIGVAESLMLDSYFSLHPALGGLKKIWDQGALGIILQVGSPSKTRSHFDAQDFMESGTPDIKSTEEGFLVRATELFKIKSSLNHLAIQTNLPRFFSGSQTALAVSEIAKFQIRGLGKTSLKGKGFEDFFEVAVDEVLKGKPSQAVDLLDRFKKINEIKNNVTYPNSALARRLKDVARVIKSDLHVPLMATEAGGWDTHRNQGVLNGNLNNLLKDFGDSISAFVQDLGPHLDDVTILTVSEFGRTVKENGTKGTDHGHGTSFFIIDKELKPKTIFGKWSDLTPGNLYEERDIPVTTDFREVFAAILKKKFLINDFTKIFPKYQVNEKTRLFI